MNIKATSGFKEPESDKAWFKEWVTRLEKVNGRTYESIHIQTSLGATHVWGVNTTDLSSETLVIFPGARTSVLFWDFDRNLDHLSSALIYLLLTSLIFNSLIFSKPYAENSYTSMVPTIIKEQDR